MSERRAKKVADVSITPACRTNRTNAGAWDEAVARLQKWYEMMCNGRGDQFTVKLTMELQEGGDE